MCHSEEYKRDMGVLFSSITNFVFTADVSPMPASCDGFAVSLWPLHRAGGAAFEKCGLVPGTEPAGALHQF